MFLGAPVNAQGPLGNKNQQGRNNPWFLKSLPTSHSSHIWATGDGPDSVLQEKELPPPCLIGPGWTFWCLGLLSSQYLPQPRQRWRGRQSGCCQAGRLAVQEWVDSPFAREEGRAFF